MSAVPSSFLDTRFAAPAPTVFGTNSRVFTSSRVTRRPILSMRVQPSGNTSLDALLPGGGWPPGSLTEILVDAADGSELGLLLPTLARLTLARRRVAIIGAPIAPESMKLAASGIDLDQLVQVDASLIDGHWNAEQHLRAGGCAAVVLWQANHDYRKLRALQMAAEAGSALAFVFRSTSIIEQPSPAPLRLKVSRGNTGHCIEILKCRGMLNA